MRVGLVSPYDLTAPGGVQAQVRDLADRLNLAGDEVTVVAPRLPDDVSGLEVGPVVRVPGNGSVAPISLMPGMRRRMRAVAGNVEVLHIHEPFMPLVGWSALALDLPRVATFHADSPAWVRGVYRRYRASLERKLGGAVLTAVSSVAAAALPSSWAPQIIPNGIEVGRFGTKQDRSVSRVAVLGRDERRKGLDVLLHAWPSILERHTGAELIVMGARRDHAPAGVVYKGRVSEEEKRAQLTSSAVLVAPNTGGESFGIIIAEAMAAGCAVVASDLPAFRDVLGDHGVLVPVGDEAAVADAVVGLLNDPDLAGQIGARAQTAASRFDWARVVDAYRSCYRQAVRS